MHLNLRMGEPRTTEPSYWRIRVKQNSICHGSVDLTMVVNDTTLKTTAMETAFSGVINKRAVKIRSDLSSGNQIT